MSCILRDGNLTRGLDIRCISNPTKVSIDTFLDPYIKPVFDLKLDEHELGYYLPPTCYMLDIQNWL
jgi:hypothetical protein